MNLAAFLAATAQPNVQDLRLTMPSRSGLPVAQARDAELKQNSGTPKEMFMTFSCAQVTV